VFINAIDAVIRHGAAETALGDVWRAVIGLNDDPHEAIQRSDTPSAETCWHDVGSWPAPGLGRDFLLSDWENAAADTQANQVDD